jgi:hypothetical protein
VRAGDRIWQHNVLGPREESDKEVEDSNGGVEDVGNSENSGGSDDSDAGDDDEEYSDEEGYEMTLRQIRR